MNAADSNPSWSDIAGWYDALVEAGSGPHQTALECLLRLIPPVQGTDVLDLACGQGMATRALAATGARSVRGVDTSEAMIDLALGHHTSTDSDVAYVVDDAQRLARFDDATFDGATCQLGLMDIPDLEATLGAVRRVLRPAGWFVFVIGHPCFLAPDAARVTADGRSAVQVSGYLQERFWRSSNPNGVRRAGTYHRTLSTYLNALVQSRFALELADEPKANALLAHQQPVYEEVPIFFAARVRAT